MLINLVKKKIIDPKLIELMYPTESNEERHEELKQLKQFITQEILEDL